MGGAALYGVAVCIAHSACAIGGIGFLALVILCNETLYPLATARNDRSQTTIMPMPLIHRKQLEMSVSLCVFFSFSLLFLRYIVYL